jgi:hypothetical protein
VVQWQAAFVTAACCATDRLGKGRAHTAATRIAAAVLPYISRPPAAEERTSRCQACKQRSLHLSLRGHVADAMSEDGMTSPADPQQQARYATEGGISTVHKLVLCRIRYLAL